MADEFKTYDKAPIVHTLSISKWSFNIREVILAIICVILFILVLVFAGLFGKAEDDLNHTETKASAVVGNSFCVDKNCLATAARAAEFMNTSVAPCDNFYQYACGNYANVRPLGPNRGTRSVYTDLSEANIDKIETIMEQPVQRMTDWAAERKLKELFHSCTDMYTREKLGGKPFLEKVVQPLGGWQLLGTWDEDSWDLNTAVKKVQADFWVDALYQPRIRQDYYQKNQRVIQLAPAGVGKWMYFYWYLSPHTEKYRQDYKTFIRRVGSMLLRDSEIVLNDTVKEERLDQFVNDTFTMEYHIAQTAHNTRYTEDPYLEVNKVSLADLNRQTNSVIDWLSQMTYLLPDGGVTGSTKVVLLREEYFTNITNTIAALPDEDRKRIMHNYLIWRVAEIYAQDMSWEYIHANREIYVDIHGFANFMGGYRYCFATAQHYMRHALSALFISDHFSDENRQAVSDITSHLKTVLQQQLDMTPWFDDSTRQYAKEKLDHVTFKMGYPDWMANHDVVDREYIGVNINISDFFGNLLSASQYHKSLWSKSLREGENRQDWLFNTYDTTMALVWDWNEVIATAGALQTPVYDKNQPHYSTFGSFGVTLAKALHHVVDDWGKHFDKFGNYMGYDKSFWSNSSIQNYQKDKVCVDDLYYNKTTSFTYPNGDILPVPVASYINTPNAIAQTSGVRLALKGYALWAQEQRLAEKMLPGLSLTNEQMVMLSWAQTECTTRTPYFAFYNALRGGLEEEINVNTALGELEEFSKAFNCKVGDNLNHEKRCQYF